MLHISTKTVKRGIIISLEASKTKEVWLVANLSHAVAFSHESVLHKIILSMLGTWRAFGPMVLLSTIALFVMYNTITGSLQCEATLCTDD